MLYLLLGVYVGLPISPSSYFIYSRPSPCSSIDHKQQVYSVVPTRGEGMTITQCALRCWMCVEMWRWMMYIYICNYTLKVDGWLHQCNNENVVSFDFLKFFFGGKRNLQLRIHHTNLGKKKSFFSKNQMTLFSKQNRL
jgi:hypothetical protein